MRISVAVLSRSICCLLVLSACGDSRTETVGGATTSAQQSTITTTTLPGPSSTSSTTLPAANTILAVADGRIVSVSPSDGAQTSVLYDSIPRVVGQFSARRGGNGVELYASLETGDRCRPKIHRIADMKATDTGIVGLLPKISPDGKLLAYTRPNSSQPSEAGSCPWLNLVVRDLSTGAEREWTPPVNQGIRWLVWSSDGQRIVYQPSAEAFTGDVFALDPKAASGPLNASATPLVSGLQPREWADRPLTTAQGVFVALYCCRGPNDAVGSKESVQFGVVSPSGQLRRIPTAPMQGLELVTAVDPAVTQILLYDSSTNVLTRANVDGTNRTRLNSASQTMLWL